MPGTASKIRFKAKLLRPAETGKDASWTFLILPKIASAKLPSRGMTAIEGTLNDFPFQAMVEPDGQKSHWLKVDRNCAKLPAPRRAMLSPLRSRPRPENRNRQSRQN